jgi:hypothetical protein
MVGGGPADDVRKKTLLSLTMVFDCGRFGALLEWRRERTEE